jgi:lipopolysaccharide transport system ATP-binding protein
MSNIAIKVENLSKIYRIGEIGTGTISRDMERWFKTKVLKKDDPFGKIGERNNRSTKGSSDYVYSLQEINFQIQCGDAVGIIGRNGAGKSTLLKILSRVTSPTTGKINIQGRVASLLEVGTGFHPELTGRENIYLNGAILGMRKREIDSKLDEIIDFSGVERYIDTPVKRYSSGMYVRLAFAVAAHLESEILIVDEVLAVGDADFQKKCLGKMGEVSKAYGRTVLFVSHNMSSINSLCPTSILLKSGRLLEHGRTNDVIHEYSYTNTNRDFYKNLSPKDFEFYSVNISNLEGKLVFNHVDAIAIDLKLFIPYKMNGLNIGIAVLDELKQKIFTSHYPLTNYDYEQNILLKKVIIPGGLLLSGSYSIDIATFIPNMTTFSYVNDAFSFDVSDQESDYCMYSGSQLGSVLVDCKWV